MTAWDGGLASDVGPDLAGHLLCRSWDGGGSSVPAFWGSLGAAALFSCCGGREAPPVTPFRYTESKARAASAGSSEVACSTGPLVRLLCPVREWGFPGLLTPQHPLGPRWPEDGALWPLHTHSLFHGRAVDLVERNDVFETKDRSWPPSV